MTYYDGDYEITVTTGHARSVGKDMSHYCRDLNNACDGLIFIVNTFIPVMIGIGLGLAVLGIIF